MKTIDSQIILVISLVQPFIYKCISLITSAFAIVVITIFNTFLPSNILEFHLVILEYKYDKAEVSGIQCTLSSRSPVSCTHSELTRKNS